ncbi:TetR family transcriptional regulator [Marmoricola endophyticus]|uniref:TetR family transcriptional regulator n=1 Tax=Marmoricola endophyticus TaxID=2040280 RepID=A0A917BMJ3_9ACTN|nr:TetR/AcrR family transcriptional regulator [Marmoricola endophyticus]GGF50760.1 TetR family transcriptional regulator [Marmoricola endophyticus]
MPSTDASVEQRLRTAALELFAEQGYDATTVEAIAARAGVGRTTFFRTFDSKEAAVFPDHELVLEDVAARLRAAGPGGSRAAVVEAAMLVLSHYLADGEVARTRYRLTRTIPALRQREIAGLHRYQRLFGDFLNGPGADLVGAAPDADARQLRAEVAAAAIVTTHNHVLRRWLRHDLDDPSPVLERALDDVVDAIAVRPAEQRAAVLVVRSRADLDAALPEIRRVLGDP